MKPLSESYIKRLKQLAGIDEAFGDTTTDADREEAFAKTNERVPYKKDLMIYAIKGGFEIGLLFKTNNDKDKMPISKYRTVLPLAIGMNKKGNEVVSGFHKIGQSESEARKTGKRSAEAKNEWRLFKTKNILSMWLTGKTFDKAPDGFKGSRDSRMTTVEAFFNPAEAKKIQLQQNAEKEQKSGIKKQLTATPQPVKPTTPINKKPAKIAPKPEIKPIEKTKAVSTKKPLGYKSQEEPVEEPKYRNRKLRNYYPEEK